MPDIPVRNPAIIDKTGTHIVHSKSFPIKKVCVVTVNRGTSSSTPMTGDGKDSTKSRVGAKDPIAADDVTTNSS